MSNSGEYASYISKYKNCKDARLYVDMYGGNVYLTCKKIKSVYAFCTGCNEFEMKRNNCEDSNHA